MDEISPPQFLCFGACFERNQACFLFHLPILTRRPCVVYFDQQMDASHVICLGVLSSFSFTYGKKEERSSLVGHWLSAPRDHDSNPVGVEHLSESFLASIKTMFI